MRTPLLPMVGLLVALLTVGSAFGCGNDVPAPTEPNEPSSEGAGEFRFVDPNGSDSGSGAKGDPWENLDFALKQMEAGQTLTLNPGEYGARGETIAIERGGEEGAPITVRGAAGGDRATILGAVRLEASHIHVENLVFAGPTGTVKEPTQGNPRGEQVQIAIDGGDGGIRDIWVRNSEIRDSDWHAGIFVADAVDVEILGNYIHGNGDEDDPSQENQSHGVYWDSGSGLVANNLIEDNLARGVQLFPEPSGVTVAFNTIVENGKAGVQVGEQGSDNLIVNNVIAFNGDLGVRSSDLSGDGNLVVTNLLWDNVGVVDVEAEELEIRDLIIDPPDFTDGFVPGPDSAARGRAADDFRIDRDIDGTVRPQGMRSDLGAYEAR